MQLHETNVTQKGSTVIRFSATKNDLRGFSSLFSVKSEVGWARASTVGCQSGSVSQWKKDRANARSTSRCLAL